MDKLENWALYKNKLLLINTLFPSCDSTIEIENILMFTNWPRLLLLCLPHCRPVFDLMFLRGTNRNCFCGNQHYATNDVD